MKKILLIIFLLMFILPSSVFAVIDYNIPRPDAATSGLTSQFDGMRIHTGENITVTKIGVVSTTVFDTLKIIDENNTTIENVTYHAGDYNYTFNANLTANKDYWIVIWDVSGTFSYRAVGGTPYNHTGTYLNWTGSVNGDPANAPVAQDATYSRSIDFIEYILTNSTPTGCTLDSDCGLCEKCNTTTSVCVNQNSSEDLKGECSVSYTSCTNAYTKSGQNGLCDGAGACTTGILANVSAGSVCAGGNETKANFTNFCDIWAECTVNATTVNSYYVGYTGNGTNTCIDNNWTKINEEWISYTNTTGWTATYGASVLYYNGAYWYMGGLNSLNKGKNEVWNSTNGKNWTQVTASANWSGRYDFGSYIFDNKMWVVAGSNGSNIQTNDVWWSTNGKDWYNVTNNAEFFPRYAFGHFVFNGKMWVIGGYGNSSVEESNDVWYSSDGIVWNSTTLNASFPKRSHTRAMNFNHSMYVMGGYNIASGYLNDVWKSNDGITWVQLTTPVIWSTRAHFGVASLDKMYVYGGSNGGGYNNEVWASYNGNNWTQLNNAYWSVRTYLGYSVVAGNGRLIVAGGTAGPITTDFYTTSNWSTRFDYRVNVTENASTCQEILLEIPPVMVSVNITPITAYSNTTLVGVCNATDADGGTIQFYYAWYNNTVLQSNGLNSTIPNETNYHNVGDKWSLSCIANDGINNSSILYSNNVTIQDYPPLAHTARISPNLSYINTTLNGYCNVSHYDNTSFNISYAWYKNQTISCYQETATLATSCGGLATGNYGFNYSASPVISMFFINYTKPNNALNSSVWQVKHGSNGGADGYTYNITLPYGCWQQSKLLLGIHSQYIFGSNQWSEPFCYNGTSWEFIGNNYTGISTGSGGTSFAGLRLYDGDWGTGAGGFGSLLEWVWEYTGLVDDNSSNKVYEEAMYWSINNITSVTNGTYINGTNYGETNVNNYTLNNSDYGYDYYLSCNGYDSWSVGNTVYSASQKVNDLILYNTTNDDSTSTYPEIGDIIQLDGNITSRDYVDSCRLVVNDTGTWRYPTDYVNMVLVNTTGVTNLLLPFTFYVTTNSTVSNNNISWRVECNDTYNTTFISNASNFTVRDVTYPTINITANSFNINTNNLTIVSGYLYNFIYNITYNDPNLFAMEVNVTCGNNGTIYYFTNVSLNPVQTYNKYDNITLNNLTMQNCTFFTAVSDDHTSKEIPEYQSEQLENGISYLTENNNLVQITTETENIEENTFTSIQIEKLVDRETFKFNYNDYATTRRFIVRADNPIYYIEGSKYPAHFVVWNAKEFKGNWLDFNDEVNNNEYTVEKINDYEYAVTVITIQPTNELQFSSIGGTLITNFSFTFYIGGTIFLNSNNTVNGSTFSNYSYVLQNIDSFPGINTSGNIPSNNASIQNISEGNYTLFLTHTCFFPQTTIVNVNNLSINISYDSYQSERTLLFKHVQTLLPLTNITYNITGLGIDIDGNTGTSSNLTLHLNTGIYNISWTSPGYTNMSQNITTTCLENTTTTLYTSYIATFNLWDELLSSTTGSNVVFNLSGATSVSFLLFCPGETISQIVNSTNFTTVITCPYRSFEFLLLYGTSSYYRSFILDPTVTNDYPIYLIDQLTTPYLFNSLVADDLLNKYINPRIFVLKTIGNQTVQITSDFADIEQKIGAYLIENHKYIVQILSDNLPLYTIGDYSASLSGTKNIRLYQVGLYDPASGGNETILGNFFILNSTQDNSTIRFRYQDDRGNTTSTLFKVYQNNTAICSLLTLNSNNLISDCPITGYNRSVVRVEVTQTVDGVTTTWSRILRDITEIGLPILQYFGQTQVNWFLIIIIASLALFGTIQTTNIYMVGLLGIAILFNVFGWLTIATSVLAFTAMVAMIAIFKEGDKSN